MVIFLPKMPFIHIVYTYKCMVLANPSSTHFNTFCSVASLHAHTAPTPPALCVSSAMREQLYAKTALCVSSSMREQLYAKTALCVSSSMREQLYA
jgi:hypothetical protein